MRDVASRCHPGLFGTVEPGNGPGENHVPLVTNEQQGPMLHAGGLRVAVAPRGACGAPRGPPREQGWECAC
eukprot:6472049-Amphidinium_carterae.1